MIFDNDIAVCETVTKPITRRIASSFFENLLETSFENFFQRGFWAIQRFHHLL